MSKLARIPKTARLSEAHQLFRPVFTKDRLMLLDSMLHFPENKRDSSILGSYLYITEFHNKM